MNFHGLLTKEVIEVGIENVQDVTHQVYGGVQILFNYGNVIVQTEGPLSLIKFERVPDPAKVQKVILDLSEADREGENATG